MQQGCSLWKFIFSLKTLQALMAMVFSHYCSMHMDEFGTSDLHNHSFRPSYISPYSSKASTENYSIQVIIIILWFIMRIGLLHYFNDHDCDSLMQITKGALKSCILLLYNSTHYLINTLKLSCMNTEREFEVKLINQRAAYL